MVLDGALADAQIRRDVLARMSGQHALHHLALAQSQPGQIPRGVRPPRRGLFAAAREIERVIDAGEQFVGAHRLFDEIRRAGLHRLDRDRHVADARDHDRRQSMPALAQMPQQVQSAHARQIGVQQEAIARRGLKGSQERLAAVEGFDAMSRVLEHGAKGAAHQGVVIDDIDRPRRVAWGSLAKPGVDRRRGGGSSRQQLVQRLRQLVQLHRFAEVDASVQRDVPRGLARDVARQDDRGELAVQPRPESRGKRHAVHAVGQVVVRENEGGPIVSRIDQPKRRAAVDGGGHVIAFVAQEKPEQVAHFGVILDDEHGPPRGRGGIGRRWTQRGFGGRGGGVTRQFDVD